MLNVICYDLILWIKFGHIHRRIEFGHLRFRVFVIETACGAPPHARARMCLYGRGGLSDRTLREEGGLQSLWPTTTCHGGSEVGEGGGRELSEAYIRPRRSDEMMGAET